MAPFLLAQPWLFVNVIKHRHPLKISWYQGGKRAIWPFYFYTTIVGSIIFQLAEGAGADVLSSNLDPKVLDVVLGAWDALSARSHMLCERERTLSMLNFSRLLLTPVNRSSGLSYLFTENQYSSWRPEIVGLYIFGWLKGLYSDI